MNHEAGESKREPGRLGNIVNRMYLGSRPFQGEEKNSVLPWQDAPAFSIKPRYKFTTTDRQNRLEGRHQDEHQDNFVHLLRSEGFSTLSYGKRLRFFSLPSERLSLLTNPLFLQGRCEAFSIT